ncbi:MAG: hypothetical protein NT036_05895 [Candidatus Omnitrophica bacterium]|nr:hypothetical protein [Candidatus Omnitrophota bacterium]
MRNRLPIVILVAAIYLMIAAGFVSAQEAKKVGMLERIKKSYNDFRNRGQQKPQVLKKESLPIKPIERPKAIVPKKELTKEEKLAEFKEDLAVNEEVFDMVPGLKAEKDPDGKALYTFNGMKLEDLSKEDLDGIFSKAGQVMVRLRTERIQRQLDTVNRAQALQRPAAAPQLPRIPAQAQSTRIPSAPPSAPRPPSLPPAVPQRR